MTQIQQFFGRVIFASLFLLLGILINVHVVQAQIIPSGLSISPENPTPTDIITLTAEVSVTASDCSLLSSPITVDGNQITVDATYEAGPMDFPCFIVEEIELGMLPEGLYFLTFNHYEFDLTGLVQTLEIAFVVGNPPGGLPPVAVNDYFETSLPSWPTVTLNVLDNEYDPNGLTEYLEIVDVIPISGTADVQFSPTIDYIVYVSFTEGVDSFYYVVENLLGLTDTALVVVHSTGDEPIVIDDIVSTPENTLVNVAVYNNDVLAGIGGNIISEPPNFGNAFIEANWSVSYTPNAGFAGIDSFSYTIQQLDGQTGEATVFVYVGLPYMGQPEATDDFVSTDVDTGVSACILCNDWDPNPAHVTPVIVDFSTPSNGTALIEPNNDLTYTPNFGFMGIDSLYYVVENESGITDTAWVIVSVGVDLNVISGTIFRDLNGDCVQQSDENGLAGWVVVIEPGPIYALTDENGYYEAYAADADYTISSTEPNDYWDIICPAVAHNVNFTDFGQTSAGNDFAVADLLECSLMEVTISTPILRRCFDNTYHVLYCNHGTEAGEDASILVEFEDVFTDISSTVPFSDLGDGQYSFDLGTIEAGVCGSFSIDFVVDCDVPIFTTVCTQATIFPNAPCADADPLWDGSSIEVDGYCDGDTVRYTITNVGANMADMSDYRIYEDEVLWMMTPFILTGGESLELSYFAGSATLRLEADQTIGHPGMSAPQGIVELCGDATGSTGFVTAVAQDDADEFIDIDCRQIIGSYDPNDKQAFPRGIGEENFIRSTDEIEYLIRFQNIGNDTAFTVVIIDTLAADYLDVTTFRSGVSSHPYQVELFGNGIVRWTFNDILLVDSTTNEPDSHGFVRFTIDQVADNIEGTVIENRAAIYFDFNEPVITETIFNTISDFAFETVVGIYGHTDHQLALKVYPMPVNETVTFEITGGNAVESYQIEVYDMLGKNVLTSTLENKALNISFLENGLYIYRLVGQKGTVASGKMTVQR